MFSADFAERAAGNLWSKCAAGMVRVYSENIKAANWGDALHRALEALSREPVVITPPTARAYPPEFDCPITQDIMRDPVVCADGNSYEAEAIAGWFALGRTTSPMSRAEMGTLAIPNRNLKKMIEDHLAHRPVVERELLEQARVALDHKVALEKFTQEYDAAMERLEAKSAGLYVVEAGTPSSLLPWTSGAGVGAGASATATADSSMPFSSASA